MIVVGLDLSLTSTGYATRLATSLIKPTAVTGTELGPRFARLRTIKTRVLELLVEDAPTLVVVEGPSHGSKGGHEHERGGLWWRILEAVDEAGIQVLVATPTMIKKYATGKGNAEKDDVLVQAVRRFDWFEGKNDEADALWACAMGYELIGRPIVDVPKLNVEALKTWR